MKHERPAFSLDRRAALKRMISVRVSEEQDKLLDELAPLLDLRGKAEVVRVAVDYFLAESPQAKQAVARLRTTATKGGSK